MPVQNCEAVVLANERQAQDICLLTAGLPAGAAAPRAGQFYMLRSWGADEAPLLSRPISVHAYDAGARTVSFLYQVKGTGTRRLAALEPGSALALTGPAGNGFPTGQIQGKVAVVSGGIGIAPLLLTVKALSGCAVTLCCGFRDKSYGLDAFPPYVQEIRVATDSGKEGHKGFVTDLLDPADFEKLARDCIAKQVVCYVSMERHMACGVGACLGCTHHTAHGAKCVCKDGPVFRGEELYA